jgi:hypothetical protein
MVFFFAIFALFVNVAFSTRYGVPDNRVHQYAGYLGIPRRVPNACTPANRVIYSNCGGSLVTIPGFPSRRMFLTARHCVVVRENVSDSFIVHFGDADLRLVDTTCNRVFGANTNTTTQVFSAKYAWFPPQPKNTNGIESGLGGGLFGGEYALLLLDNAVPTNQVDVEAVVFDSSSMRTNTLASFIPVVGTAGYGIFGYGTSLNNTLGKPIPSSGNRDKEYVELPVNSVQTTQITAAMNAAQYDPALCNGDSGSAAIRPAKVNGFYYAFGVVVAGDLNCRATNTYTRVGTTAYNTWVQSIKADVNAKAAL